MRGKRMNEQVVESRIRGLVENVENYDAHIRIQNTGEIIRESLTEHIKLTVKYFGEIWDIKQADAMLGRFIRQTWGALAEDTESFLKEMIMGIPLFHDLGKINPKFQIGQMKNARVKDDEAFLCINSKHSLISAVLYLDFYLQKLREEVKEAEEREKIRPLILYHSYLISRHHTDLCDFDLFLEEMILGKGQELMEIFREKGGNVYKEKFTLNTKRVKRILEINKRNIREIAREKSIALYAYEKILYSILVAADYYATTQFMSGLKTVKFGDLEEIQAWVKTYEDTDLMHSIRKYQKEQYPKQEKELEAENNINVLRTEMLCDAEKIMEENKNRFLFYLEAPTGSGKSNTALDLSLRLVNEDKNLQKIYYIYPFNTLIEQNMQSLSKIFGNKEEIFRDIAVINSLTPIKRTDKDKQAEEQTENTYYYQRALLDRQFLNYPLILSTHVSLFDTMFGNTKESAFAFHQLMNSVVVLDEIQSYNNELWGEIAYFLKVFGELMNIKIIIMSATLPDFDLLTGDIYPAVKLMQKPEKYFTIPCFRNRVEISYELLEQTALKEQDEIFDILTAHIRKFLPGKKKIIIEFIKKESAYQFYQKLRGEDTFGCAVEYMSGDDSIAERSRILKNIKETQSGIILVATQVIEAGVDIDMDIGYKNISKLDSEEQFLGRINRSCLKKGKAYFFKLDDGNGIYHGDIRIRKEFTLENEKIRNILRDKDFGQYYEKILKELKDNRNDNTGEVGLDNFFYKDVRNLQWQKVKERMKLIPDDKWNMQIYLARLLEDGEGNQIDGKIIWEEYKELLKDLSMDYSEKRVKLSEITSKMNYFIYQIKRNPDLIYHDKVGEIFYIEDGEKYFTEGKLDRKKLQGEVGEFVDFI
ncbi:CRISPR-associated helicase/endonuclease Cas3 [Clostridium sp. Marseille-P3244]|uniref:CRISPR-associated helicase/endonuclease Cas3 n=1 Tax=Clostridium sp. Marseille-P3244 TaxID=1871020 RepID=UPI0009FA7D41|nr:CRISPR-associated helicase/endonuclease Cas3 [Clostridium sp. Marseille-P3244]